MLAGPVPPTLTHAVRVINGVSASTEPPFCAMLLAYDAETVYLPVSGIPLVGKTSKRFAGVFQTGRHAREGEASHFAQRERAYHPHGVGPVELSAWRRACSARRRLDGVIPPAMMPEVQSRRSIRWRTGPAKRGDRDTPRQRCRGRECRMGDARLPACAEIRTIPPEGVRDRRGFTARGSVQPWPAWGVRTRRRVRPGCRSSRRSG